MTIHTWPATTFGAFEPLMHETICRSGEAPAEARSPAAAQPGTFSAAAEMPKPKTIMIMLAATSWPSSGPTR